MSGSPRSSSTTSARRSAATTIASSPVAASSTSKSRLRRLVRRARAERGVVLDEQDRRSRPTPSRTPGHGGDIAGVCGSAARADVRDALDARTRRLGDAAPEAGADPRGGAEVEALGLTVHAQYALMGQYDFLNIIEAPDDETMAKAAIMLAARGTMRTTTLPAIPVDDLIERLKS